MEPFLKRTVDPKNVLLKNCTRRSYIPVEQSAYRERDFLVLNETKLEVKNLGKKEIGECIYTHGRHFRSASRCQGTPSIAWLYPARSRD